MDELIKNNIEVINLELLASKGLYEKQKISPKYYKLYRIYKILLDRYLVKKLKLDSYDKSIDDSGLKFLPIKQEDMDYYQYVSAMNLKYFYLRNNIYVEKLSREYIDKLLTLTDKDLMKPSNEIEKIIESTYRDVIDANISKDAECMSCYGPDNDRYWFPSNELIIGFRHDDFGDNGLGTEEDWSDNNNKQIMFLNAIKDSLKKEAVERLKIPVNVVWYNEFTIKETVSIKK